MEPITLTFLGTGNAIPTPTRNHSALMLTYKNLGLLIDCGEGTQRQFPQAELSPHKITHLCITHWHGDHILGLPGLIQSLGMSDYAKTLHLYGPKGSVHFMHTISQLITGMPIKIEVHEVTPGTIVETPEWKIEAFAVYHECPALGYSFIIKEKTRLDKTKLKKLKLPNIPQLGQLAVGKAITVNGKTIKPSQVTYQEPERKVTVILDTGYKPILAEHAKGAQLLITEASFAQEETDKAQEYHHLTSTQAANIAKQAKAQALMLTHISQRYEHRTDLLLKEAKKVFKNTQTAKDFDSLTL
ncbi:ribonuclease Z [Candidatus Pacearchaeota archaeon]|nr:ribonuclease Z [Candidatus Pacearchaeota archaeon]